MASTATTVASSATTPATPRSATLSTLPADAPYPLALPRGLRAAGLLICILVMIGGLCLDIPEPLVMLVVLLAWRCERLGRRQAHKFSAAALRRRDNGRFDILGIDGRDLHNLSLDELLRFPGFSVVRFCRSNGKPLEILIFCRYDRRRSYRRLVRHLMYHRD